MPCFFADLAPPPLTFHRPAARAFGNGWNWDGDGLAPGGAAAAAARRLLAVHGVSAMCLAAAVLRRAARQQDAAKCAVCLGRVLVGGRRAAAVLACGHRFHARCIGRWASRRVLAEPREHAPG